MLALFFKNIVLKCSVEQGWEKQQKQKQTYLKFHSGAMRVYIYYIRERIFFLLFNSSSNVSIISYSTDFILNELFLSLIFFFLHN